MKDHNNFDDLPATVRGTTCPVCARFVFAPMESTKLTYSLACECGHKFDAKVADLNRTERLTAEQYRKLPQRKADSSS